MIAIVDYGAGNVRSVSNAIAKLGHQAKVISEPSEVANAEAIIVPGVGSAADAMANLRALKLTESIKHWIAEGRPFLGICVGLQVLLTVSEEGGCCECLGIVPGRVRRLPRGQKVPHMGWNQVKQKVSHPVFDGVPDEASFYFLHSYYVDPVDKSLVIGETEYGIPICSVIAAGNLIATQFHPEKSGKSGLKMYENFIRLATAHVYQ